MKRGVDKCGKRMKTELMVLQMSVKGTNEEHGNRVGARRNRKSLLFPPQADNLTKDKRSDSAGDLNYLFFQESQGVCVCVREREKERETM